MRGRRIAFRPACRLACPARGFTLVEVLVALFVVALGVTGAAAVQAMAVRAADQAARLSDGLRLADALAQRKRAQTVAMALPDAANPYLQFDAAPGAAPAPAPACYGASSCNSQQMAQFDLSETAALLASRFPGGRMRVCRDAPHPDAAGLLAWACTDQPGAPVAIKFGWRGRPDDADALAVFLMVGAGAP
jgi:type IV pilus assembly protein PilV